MLRSLKVRDYLTPHALTLKVDMPLAQALERLLAHHLSGATVLDAQGVVCGYLSDEQCLRAALDLAYYDASGAGTVGASMDRQWPMLNGQSSVLEAAQLMLDQGYGCLPVLEQGRLLGEISRLELLKVLQQFIRHAPDQPQA